MQIILLVAGLILVLVAMYAVYGSLRNKAYAPTRNPENTEMIETDEDLMEQEEVSTEDNSLETIESELDATVILEEEIEIQ